MISLWQYRGMSPERNKDAVQPGTFIAMSERVRFIWASNTAGVIMFVSVKSLCSTEPITEDAKETNEQPRTRSTPDIFHVVQDVSNTKREAQQSLVYGVCPEVTQWQLSVFCFAELHHVCHYGPTDKQYQMHPLCWKPWRGWETHVPKREREQREGGNCVHES